jgi:hypothetical protein
LVATGKRGKPLLGVIGFLGRGNVGDEAIFQCIYEAFEQQFDLVVAVDETGARQGWWDWYPYTQVERIHQGNIHYFHKRCAGLLIGGGGLGLGFGGSQLIVATGAGTPAAFAGTDHTHTVPAGPKGVAATRLYLGMFDHIALRSKVSLEWAHKDGVNAVFGADWAFNLRTDESREVRNNPKRALVTFREFAPQQFDAVHYKKEATALLAGLRAQGYEPVLLPFAPEDERFAKELGLDRLAHSEIHWWNARRIQQIIASSGLLVSVGRLHAMIFAANVGTPNIQLVPPLRPGMPKNEFQKMYIMANELAVPNVTTVDEALELARNGIDTTDMNAAVAETRVRLAQMIADLHKLFGN